MRSLIKTAWCKLFHRKWHARLVDGPVPADKCGKCGRLWFDWLD